VTYLRCTGQVEADPRIRPHRAAGTEGGDMLRRSHILTTAALLAVCATPASAATYEQLRAGESRASGDVPPPPSSMAASAADEYKDLRSPDAVDAAGHRGLYAADRDQYALNRDYGSPDAADAARDLPSAPAVTHAGPGPYNDSERRLVESPEVQDMVRRISREIRETPTVVVAGEPSGAFDWGDAGIGAAGMLALFSIAAGSALLLGGRRRRRGVRVATR
jgi:hypothetical protein